MKSKRVNHFISMHIPKTGGTVFNRRILRSAFYVVTDYLDGDPYFKKEKRYRNPARSDVVHGHFRSRKYSRHGLPMVVWLRDPVARVMSHYEYAKRNPRWICANAAEGRTLIEFADVIPDTMSYYLDGMELQDFLFVGVLELFEDSMKRLEEVVDIDVKPFVDGSFVQEISGVYKHQRRDVTEEEKQAIMFANRNDCKLYDAALEMYGKGGGANGRE